MQPNTPHENTSQWFSDLSTPTMTRQPYPEAVSATLPSITPLFDFISSQPENEYTV